MKEKQRGKRNETDKTRRQNNGGGDISLQQMNLIDFLHYVERSSKISVPDECDERLKHLHRIIEEIKSSEKMEAVYMKMEERDRLIKEEGKYYKLIELICKKLKRGKSPEEIAEDLEEDLETVQNICDAAVLYEPDYDVVSIYEEFRYATGYYG